MNILIDADALLDRELWRCLVRYISGYTCERCGREYEEGIGKFAAHHKNGNGKDHRLSNGELLCAACHRQHHNPELRGVPKTQQHRERVALGQKRRWASYTPERRAEISANMSAAQKARFADPAQGRSV